jgi:hypothetical protein
MYLTQVKRCPVLELCSQETSPRNVELHAPLG